jgi:O-acetyl-ADP-ribose deacetylase (regulator of RNase III)
VIEIRLGDLTDVAVAAFLRPIAADGSAATAAARRIEVAAGPVPAEQLQRFGELPVGSAVITVAGALAAEYLVHVVVRSFDQPVTAEVVRRALVNGLRRLDEWGIESVALPLLGTGAGNLDPEAAAAVLMPTLLESYHAAPRRVVIMVESEYEWDLVERELERLAGSRSGP